MFEELWWLEPVDFGEANCKYAEKQDEYLNLPALKCEGGDVISCWRLTLWQRLKLLVTGRVWLMQMTFHDPLQPVCMRAAKPFHKE